MGWNNSFSFAVTRITIYNIMRKTFIILICLSLVIGCKCRQNEAIVASTTNTEQKTLSRMKERISIYDCKDINGEYVCSDLCPRIIVREYEDGYLNKETEYLNNEIIGVIRYRIDDNNNLYMTNTYKGKVITKIYKDENCKWIIEHNGEIMENSDGFELSKPEYCSWIESVKTDISLLGGEDIKVDDIVYGDNNHKLDAECYITYILPDDKEEIILVKREII